MAVLSALVLAIVVPIAGEPWATVPAFIPAYQSAVAVNDLVTATLLFGLFRELRRVSLLLLAGGYLFTAALVVAHAMSFPDLFGPGSLIGGPQTTVWLWVAWHIPLPLVVCAYALLAAGPRDAVPAARSTTTAMATAVLLPLAVAGLLIVLAAVGQDRLPALLEGNRYIPGVTRPALAVPLVLSVLVLLCHKTTWEVLR